MLRLVTDGNEIGMKKKSESINLKAQTNNIWCKKKVESKQSQSSYSRVILRTKFLERR